MGKFGWSLPPGVHTLPGEEPCMCEVCGQDVDSDKCICPECPVCGTYGDPDCYKNHGLEKTEEQKALWDKHQKDIEEQNRAEYEAYKELYEEDE